MYPDDCVSVLALRREIEERLKTCNLSCRYSFFHKSRLNKKISRNIEKPAAQIVSGLLFRYSWTSKEPENSMPITETIRISFRPVTKTIFPIQVSRRIINKMVYMVNPYMQEG